MGDVDDPNVCVKVCFDLLKETAFTISCEVSSTDRNEDTGERNRGQ